MFSRVIFILSIASTCLLVQSKPWEPEPRDQNWINRHNEFVEYSRVNGSSIRILFTGSSVMEFWSTTASALFNSKYVPLGTVNYGIGGDQIQHLLWRVINGELDNINPEMIVIYCGSNNVPVEPSNGDIVRGITTTIQEIANRLPQTKILYVTINPRADVPDVTGTWTRIQTINEQVRQAFENSEKVTIWGFFNELILSWGQLNTGLYLGDNLHLNEAGYGVWDSSWNNTFFDLLNN